MPTASPRQGDDSPPPAAASMALRSSGDVPPPSPSPSPPANGVIAFSDKGPRNARQAADRHVQTGECSSERAEIVEDVFLRDGRSAFFGGVPTKICPRPFRRGSSASKRRASMAARTEAGMFPSPSRLSAGTKPSQSTRVPSISMTLPYLSRMAPSSKRT